MEERLMTDSYKFSLYRCTILSGGQTGADRAALDWACHNNIEHAGWCPKGRLAADGPIPLRYRLRETESTGYRQRTKLNVQDSDATLIFNMGALDGGSLQTARFAQILNKPCRVFQLDQVALEEVASDLIEWLAKSKFVLINVAGPREEKRAGIYALVFSVLNHCLNLSKDR
jgi:hypothetical protein